MVAWISFFDIGFTQGLRNKFAAAKAKGELHLAKIYVSTAYFFISLIFISLWFVLMVINRFVNWSILLNLPQGMNKEIINLASIIITYFCLQFIFKVINTLLIADQRPSLASLLDLLGQILSLIAIYLLTIYTKGSLINLGLALTIAPTIIIVGANFFFFGTKYKDFAPSYHYVKKEYTKDIVSLGLKFFVVQIAAVIQYQTILFLIAHYFNTLQVTSYNIAFKYFGVLQMAFMILVTPLWSGATDAYTKSDFDWIRNAVKKYLFILVFFVLVGSVMLTFAESVYGVWLGKNTIYVPFNISLLCYIFFSISMFGSIFVFVINGIGALKIQFYTSLITAFGFVVLSISLIKIFHFGIESILISSIISNVFGLIIAPLQYYNIIIKKSKSNIWYA
jgi:O-antigen/teichoic acid export membrane protein